MIGDYAVRAAMAEMKTRPAFQRSPMPREVFSILRSGVNDVHNVVRHTIKLKPEVKPEDLLDILHQDKSIETIARHARLTEKHLSSVLRDNLDPKYSESHSISLDDENSTLETTKFFDEWIESPLATRGCPLAEPKPGDELDPLFVKFTKWSSELGIRSMYAFCEKQRN